MCRCAKNSCRKRADATPQHGSYGSYNACILRAWPAYFLLQQVIVGRDYRESECEYTERAQQPDCSGV